MNPFRLLYHNSRHDDVVFAEGNRIGIGFRKTLLMLDRESFYAFLSLLRYTRENSSLGTEPAIQSLMVDTPCRELSLLLTREELDRLLKMLEAARECLDNVGEGSFAVNSSISLAQIQNN
ncbi:MAG: hypothetical protein KF862_14920 [Chitinophagaceae bacterium]|nr:hypothetical protein [Chitinophagaceae bacterium]